MTFKIPANFHPENGDGGKRSQIDFPSHQPLPEGNIFKGPMFIHAII